MIDYTHHNHLKEMIQPSDNNNRGERLEYEQEKERRILAKMEEVERARRTLPLQEFL